VIRQITVDRAPQVARRRSSRCDNRPPLGQQRHRQCRFVRTARIEQKPAQPGMERQPVQPAAGIGQSSRRIDGTETLQQRQGGVNRVCRRGREPLEGAWIGAPRQHVEDRPGQINALDVRLPVRPQTRVRIPEPSGAAGRHATSAPCPLVGRID
jgi:hypothetical protein